MPPLLLHTAALHVDTFDRLRDQIAPDLTLRHEVRPDWLDAARAGRIDDVAPRISALAAATDGPFLCTCTTLGPLVEAAGGMRVDRPMMREAARIGGRILMAYTLESTKAPSRALFTELADDRSDLRMLDLTGAWPLFEAQQTDGFHDRIATGIRTALAEQDADLVVLAQVSMAGAADLLQDCGVPVLTSPREAMRALAAHRT